MYLTLSWSKMLPISSNLTGAPISGLRNRARPAPRDSLALRFGGTSPRNGGKQRASPSALAPIEHPKHPPFGPFRAARSRIGRIFQWEEPLHSGPPKVLPSTGRGPVKQVKQELEKTKKCHFAAAYLLYVTSS